MVYKKQFWTLFLSVVVTLTAYSQKDTVEVNLSMKSYRPNSESDFTFFITIVSHSKDPFFIPDSLYYGVESSDFGDIRFEHWVLNDDCFQKSNIDHDPSMEDVLRKITFKKIVFGDALRVEYDFRNFTSMPSGVYKFRAALHYRTANKIALKACPTGYIFKCLQMNSA